ncbi:MAG: Wzt carbohydrate-binding domain-containing protein, partial [Acidobacteriota bacterium]
GEPFSIEIQAVLRQAMRNVSVVIGLETDRGTRITTAASEESGVLLSGEKGSRFGLRAVFDDLPLNAGRFQITLSARINRSGVDLLRPAVAFDVSQIRHPRVEGLADLWGAVRSRPLWSPEVPS